MPAKLEKRIIDVAQVFASEEMSQKIAFLKQKRYLIFVHNVCSMVLFVSVRQAFRGRSAIITNLTEHDTLIGQYLNTPEFDEIEFKGVNYHRVAVSGATTFPQTIEFFTRDRILQSVEMLARRAKTDNRYASIAALLLTNLTGDIK